MAKHTNFYTDLDASNVMDNKPFLVLDLTAIDETLLPEVAKLTKESFDLDSVVSAAGELKYVGQIKRVLAAEFREPSNEFLRLFATHVYPGRFTQRIRDDIAPLASKATSQFLNEHVRERLKTALEDDGKAVKGEAQVSAQMAPLVVVAEDDLQGDVATTDEELEGYRIVRAIVCSEVPAGRVTGRDSKTYFAILLDNNNRKPIARLWFNRKQKYLRVLNSNKIETRLPIETLEDIYQCSAQLRSTVSGYLTPVPPGSSAQESSDTELKESAGVTD